jgi:hypothetical protein
MGIAGANTDNFIVFENGVKRNEVVAATVARRCFALVARRREA